MALSLHGLRAFVLGMDYQQLVFRSQSISQVILPPPAARSSSQTHRLRFSEPFGIAKRLILQGNFAPWPKLCPFNNRIELAITTAA
jgi:hypothetical protein